MILHMFMEPAYFLFKIFMFVVIIPLVLYMLFKILRLMSLTPTMSYDMYCEGCVIKNQGVHGQSGDRAVNGRIMVLTEESGC